MVSQSSRPVAGALLLVALTAPPLWGQAIAYPPDPVTSYESFQRHGFKVMVTKRLQEGGPCLQCLDERLKAIAETVPAVHLGILHGVTIWIETGKDGPVAPSIFENSSAFYVPLDTTFRPTLYGLPGETRGGVVVIADRCLSGVNGKWATEIAPGYLLHEMAHAIHDRLLGYDESSVQAAYQRALDGKIYDAVPTRIFDKQGQSRIERRPAYARTNEREYFAELSVAYLGQRNYYYPQTRDDLFDHDPVGYVLMDSFWRPEKWRIANDLPWPVSVDRVAKTGRRFRAFDLMPGKEKALDGWAEMAVVVTDMLDGKEYRVETPQKNAKLWRVASNTMGLMPSPQSGR